MLITVQPIEHSLTPWIMLFRWTNWKLNKEYTDLLLTTIIYLMVHSKFWIIWTRIMHIITNSFADVQFRKIKIQI
jgi:hypothetical protein